jgi:hypothetical protein
VNVKPSSKAEAGQAMHPWVHRSHRR